MNYSIAYSCIGLYLFIGLVSLIVKSPVSKAVEVAMGNELFRYRTRKLIYGEEIPQYKIKLYRLIFFMLALFFYPMIGYENIQKQKAAALKQSKPKAYTPSFGFILSWTRKKVSVLEAENNHLETIGDKQVPFGGNHSLWQILLSKMQDGDELWEYTSDDKSWEMMAGREGILLVRDEKIIDDILLRMN